MLKIKSIELLAAEWLVILEWEYKQLMKVFHKVRLTTRWQQTLNLSPNLYYFKPQNSSQL